MDGSTVVDEMQGHNHNYDTQRALVCKKMSNILKQKAVNCLSDKPSKVIHSAVMKDGTKYTILSDAN